MQRLVLALRDMSYKERLKELNLMTLEDRRAREDMVTIYKMLREIDRAERNRLFVRLETGTQGHR